MRLGGVDTQMYFLRSRKSASRGPQTALSFLAAESEEQGFKIRCVLELQASALAQGNLSMFRIKAGTLLRLVLKQRFTEPDPDTIVVIDTVRDGPSGSHRVTRSRAAAEGCHGPGLCTPLQSPYNIPVSEAPSGEKSEAQRG